MITAVNCAIRGCPRMARIDSRELIGQGRFALCHDCETSIVLDVHLSIEQNEHLPPGTTRAYAAVYNGWVRNRKGLSLGHRSGVVTSVKDLEATIVVREGN